MINQSFDRRIGYYWAQLTLRILNRNLYLTVRVTNH